MENYTDSCSPEINLYNAADSLVWPLGTWQWCFALYFQNLSAGNYQIVAASGNCSEIIVTINDGPCDIQFNIAVTQGNHGCNANRLNVTYTGNICGPLSFGYQK
jgi:hypothetical protein